MTEVPTSLLVDAKGEALVSQQSLPDLRVFTNRELTSMCSAILRVLVTIHGPEVMQLVAIHAEDIEAQLPIDPEAYVAPPCTDEASEAATAEGVGS